MKYLYSPSAKGFFIEGINSIIPDDAIYMDKLEYDELMTGQSEGKVITWDTGSPKLSTIDPTLAKTWDDIRQKRTRLLANCDWTQMPDADLTEAEVQAWRVYRTKLRDITEKYKTPKSVVWPASPDQTTSK